MKKYLIPIVFTLIFIVGFGVLLYPTVSSYLNSFSQSRAIAYYSDELAKVSEEDYESILEAAREYNKRLLLKEDRYTLSEEELEEYHSMLDITGRGIMGHLQIDLIGVKLPIYQGVDEAVLRVGLGHVIGTSLPVGGAGTHTVISGHRGLPSATLLTNLDKMGVGDTFIIYTLNEILTYEVDQILIVDPDDMSAVGIDPAKDYATLVTCTPYGINTHRMLVRGHRIETVISEEKTHVRVSADVRVIDIRSVAPYVAGPLMLIIMMISILLKNRKNKSKMSKDRKILKNERS